MILTHPCIITPRLLPGVQIGDSFLSIEYGDWTRDNRRAYHLYLDTPTFEWTDADRPEDQVRLGVGGGTLQRGLVSALAFLGACVESFPDGENADLFPPHVAEWAKANSDEIGMLRCELSFDETADLIEE